MKLYLDMCALERPFDDQTQERIASETRALLAIMARIESGVDSMVWSTVLTLENDADPDPEPRLEVAKYAGRAASSQLLTPEIERRAKEFTAAGLPPLDAMHLAFAEASACDFLLTCDDRFVKRARRTDCLIRVLPPIEYYGEMGDD